MDSGAFVSDKGSEPSFVKITCLLLAVFFVGVYVVMAIARMNYPFELEWMEGGTLINITRIQNGDGIYVRPTAEYAPFFYTPFYYYSAAGTSRILGAGLFSARLLSFVFSLGNFIWLFTIAYRRDRSVSAGFLSAGLFAASYWMTGQWYDLGRVDSMFLFFLLGGIYCLLYYSGWKSAALAACLIAVSYFTKQTAAAIAFWVFALELFRHPRRSLVFGLLVSVIILSFTLALNYKTDGWYGYVTYQLMLNQHYLLSSICTFWTNDILMKLPLCVAAAGWLFYRAIKVRDRDLVLRLIFLGAGMVGASWLSRINIGGFRNVLIPAVAYAAIASGWAISAFMRESAEPAVDAKRRACFVAAMVIFQFLWLQWIPLGRVLADPGTCIPSSEDRTAGYEFIDKLRAIKGDVLMPNHPYLLLMAGKKPCAHTAGVDDVIRGDNGGVEKDLTGAIRRRIQSGEYAAVVLEREWIFRRDTERHYHFGSKIFERDDVFWPVTGWRTRPEEFWIPANPKSNSIVSTPATP